MLIVQSLLVALFCVLGSVCTPFYGFTLGWYVLSRPLVGGLVCGLIFGNVTQGILLGVAIQAAYLAVVTPGGSFPAELGFISYPAMAVALASGMETGVAVSLAATIGVLGTFVLTATMSLNSVFTAMSDKAIERGDTAGVAKTFLLYPQLAQLVVRGVPAFLAVYFGAQYVQGLIDALPAFIITGLMSLGGVLPAVGIAVLLIQCMRQQSFLLFFLAGFIAVAFLGLNMIAVVILAGVFAYLYYLAKGGNHSAAPYSGVAEPAGEEEVL